MPVGGTLDISPAGVLAVFAIIAILVALINAMSVFFKLDRPGETEKAKPLFAAAEKAKGSCGEVRLYDVPDKTAAMVMALTADKLGVPLNELRFIAIKETDK